MYRINGISEKFCPSFRHVFNYVLILLSSIIQMYVLLSFFPQTSFKMFQFFIV